MTRAQTGSEGAVHANRYFMASLRGGEMHISPAASRSNLCNGTATLSGSVLNAMQDHSKRAVDWADQRGAEASILREQEDSPDPLSGWSLIERLENDTLVLLQQPDLVRSALLRPNMPPKPMQPGFFFH